MTGWFITGTDTGCGKTVVSLALMAALQERGFSVQGMKPVASGCTPVGPAGRLVNQDACRLSRQSSRSLPDDWVNPYAFAPAIAPHIAAQQAGIAIRPSVIQSRAQALAAHCDRLIVEGVGGWRVPLGPSLEVRDLPGLLGLPVILVVGLRLGCLNHALLTVESILGSGVTLAAWVANQVEPRMHALSENLATLEAYIPAPRLGFLPWRPDGTPSALARYLQIEEGIRPYDRRPGGVG